MNYVEIAGCELKHKYHSIPVLQYGASMQPRTAYMSYRLHA